MKTYLPFLSLLLLPCLIGKTGISEAGVSRPVSLYTLPGGQPAALGGAYTAIAQGPYGHLWNSAGPGLVEQTSIAFALLKTPGQENRNYGISTLFGPAVTRSNPLTGGHYFTGLVLPPDNYFARLFRSATNEIGKGLRAAMPDPLYTLLFEPLPFLGKPVGFGLYWSYYALPDLEMRDSSERLRDYFDTWDSTWLLSMGFPRLMRDSKLGDVSLGLSLAYIEQRAVPGSRAKGYSAGIGLIHQVRPYLNYGLSVRNLFSSMKVTGGTEETKDKLDYEAALGIAFKSRALSTADSLLCAFDLVQMHSDIWSFNTGVEYRKILTHTSKGSYFLACRTGVSHYLDEYKSTNWVIGLSGSITPLLTLDLSLEPTQALEGKRVNANLVITWY